MCRIIARDDAVAVLIEGLHTECRGYERAQPAAWSFPRSPMQAAAFVTPNGLHVSSLSEHFDDMSADLPMGLFLLIVCHAAHATATAKLRISAQSITLSR